MYTWGWKECVPTGKVIGEHPAIGSLEKDERQSTFPNEQGGVNNYLLTIYKTKRDCTNMLMWINSFTVSSTLHGSRSISGTIVNYDGKGSEDTAKRRRLSSAKQGPESSSPSDETLSALPCLVTLGVGVKITAVSAGGRHTLALSGDSTFFIDGLFHHPFIVFHVF